MKYSFCVSRVSSIVFNIIFGAEEDELESVNLFPSPKMTQIGLKTVNLPLIIGTNYRHTEHKIIMKSTEANKIYIRKALVESYDIILVS